VKNFNKSFDNWLKINVATFHEIWSKNSIPISRNLKIVAKLDKSGRIR
jgi:hypothetical protein